MNILLLTLSIFFNMETDSINYNLAEYKYHFDYSTCNQIQIEQFKHTTDKTPKKKALVSDKKLMDIFFCHAKGIS